MAKMCKCGRWIGLSHKACCAQCWNKHNQDHAAKLYNASQSDNAPEPVRQPQHTHTPAARPSQAVQAEARDNG